MKKSKLASRKLWVTVVSVAIAAFSREIGIDISDGTVFAFAGIVSSYLVGQSVVDFTAAKRIAAENAEEWTVSLTNLLNSIDKTGQ